MNSTSIADSLTGSAGLESILCTEELTLRPARPPDFERESRALGSLARALADAPLTILQTLADSILDVLQVGSAGISLLTEDESRFHWPAIAGQWNSHIGGGTPRDFGPCGDVLDRNRPLLFQHVERHYTYFQSVTPPAVEALLVPFYVEGKVVGTIWAIAHDDHHKFDGEDRRVLVSLGNFASAAFQTVEHLQTLSKQVDARLEAAQTMRDMNEALMLFSVRQHELTEQANIVERSLAKALVYADDIIATLREPFLVLDHDLRVKTANRSFYHSFLVSKEETENCLVYDLGNGQWDIPRLRKLLNEVLTGNQSVQDYEVEHSFPNLGLKTMLLNARPFPPDSPHPELILLAVQDVSEVKKRADELAEASRNKDEFLATLAHELRNPLSPIRNAVHYLNNEGLSEIEIKKAHDIIARQVTVMVRLVDDLLDVSRISRNKMDIRKEQVMLATVLESAIESSRPLIEQCRHELTISLPTQQIELNADPIRLAQAFLNLLNNAAKYTKPGGQIWLTATRMGSDAVISVRDNGVGIANDMLGRIFDMFTQVDRSLDQSQGGLGIGLTLVRRLIEMHDGTIEVRSNGPNKGSEFTVRLPIIEKIPPIHDRPSTIDAPKQISKSGCRILVVDDYKDAAMTMGMLLRLKGNQIETVHDGMAAVEAAEKFQPALVLLDIGLPLLNGFEVARRIRLQPWGRQMILIALTGWGQDEDKRSSQEAGFDFHLVKPVQLGTLEKLLNDLQLTDNI